MSSLSNHQLNKLQIVQNMGCRVIKNLRKFDHITEAMKDLHWLKIPEHIQFKVLVTIYQCVNGLAPSFLIDLLDLNLMRRNLRSDTQGKLPIPQCSLSQVCNSSIRYAGPRLWNELPQNILGRQKLKDCSKSSSKHIYSANVMTVNPFYLSVNILIMYLQIILVKHF